MLKKNDKNSNNEADLHDMDMVAESDADQLRENGDIEIDSDDAASGTVTKLRKELKACLSEKGEYLAGWQRTKADFVNRERELRISAERMSRASLERLLEDMLPVLDGFDMAIFSTAWQNTDASWREGMESLHKQMLSVLEKHGIEQFDPMDAPFDPAQHEAVGTAPAASPKEDGTVLAVMQKGYRVGSRVVRPARVQIAQFEK